MPLPIPDIAHITEANQSLAATEADIAALRARLAPVYFGYQDLDSFARGFALGLAVAGTALVGSIREVFGPKKTGR